jgi:hypothetical protein
MPLLGGTYGRNFESWPAKSDAYRGVVRGLARQPLGVRAVAACGRDGWSAWLDGTIDVWSGWPFEVSASLARVRDSAWDGAVEGVVPPDNGGLHSG